MIRFARGGHIQELRHRIDDQVTSTHSGAQCRAKHDMNVMAGSWRYLRGEVGVQIVDLRRRQFLQAIIAQYWQDMSAQ